VRFFVCLDESSVPLLWGRLTPQRLCCFAIYGEIPSALAHEKEMHWGRRNFLGMLGLEMGDPRPSPGHLGKGFQPNVNHPEL